ncbi:hypothetical protein [Nonomuraea bangladeshensis]|uniref:hypothetical protein n=1 Tax=Nonomuraea bangladeshensis TaxID=404385 RepID=UPI003C2DB62C
MGLFLPGTPEEPKEERRSFWSIFLAVLTAIGRGVLLAIGQALWKFFFGDDDGPGPVSPW